MAYDLTAHCPNLDDLNNMMIQAINQYQDPLYNWVFRTNPFLTLFSRAEFNAADGLIPQVITTTSELPTSYPFNLPSLTLSDGTGSSCDVDAQIVYNGSIIRNYQLEVDAAETPQICLTDLQFAHSAEQQISNYQANLGQRTTVRWSDWYRVKNIGMINTKMATMASGAVSTDQDSNYDFSGVSVPTTLVTWDHLNAIYDEQMQLGAELSAVGYSEGQPLLALTVGPGIKRRLFQTDTKVRDTVNWGDAFQNFTARGINTSINGFVPNVDLFPMRYAADARTPIYPTLNTNATKGRKFIANPAYRTVANGGSAVYEVVSILCRDIYEVRPRSSGPTGFGQATFSAQNYVGDLRWINHPDMCFNKLGNKGFFRIDMQMAAKPIRPELGVSLLTLAVDV
jgi:hypothetical protein